MKTFRDHTKSSMQGNHTFSIKHLPTELIKRKRVDQVCHVLTNISFLNAKNSTFGPQSVISDFDQAIRHGFANADLDQYREFFRKHSQKLARFKESFFTLIQFEGFPASRTSADRLVSLGIWSQPWLRVKKSWMPENLQPKLTGNKINILTQWNFEGISLACLAEETLLGFFIKRLGNIGIVDLEKGHELSGEIQIRRKRPLGLFSSANGRFIVVPFEKVVTDIIELEFDQSGEFRDSRTIASVNYYLPKIERSVMKVVGDDLWFQEDAESIACRNLKNPSEFSKYRFFKGTVVELSGIVSLADRFVFAFREGINTRLVTLNKDKDKSTSISTQKNVDVVGLCRCGQDRVAVAFTNNTVGIFQVSHTFEQLTEFALEELPAVMVGTDSELVWFTPQGTLYTWRFDSSNGPTEIQRVGDPLSYARPFDLVATSNQVLATVTPSSAISFGLNQGAVMPYHKITALFSGTGGAYYAIEETTNEVWLIDSASKSRLRVAEEPGQDYKYAMDDQSQILGIRMYSSRGFIIGSDHTAVMPIFTVPPNTTSVCGHPQGGFWLTDSFGNIFYLGPDNSIKLAHSIKLDGIRGCEVHCSRDLLIWKCSCLHQTSYGSEFVQAIVFFRLDHQHPSHLYEIGRRFFAVDDGNFQTLAYNSDQQLLWMIWQGSSRYKLFVKIGTVNAFIKKEEVEKEILDIDLDFDLGIAEIVLSPEHCGAYCLTKHGNLYRLDIESLQRQAVLSGSVPITNIAREDVEKDSLLCVSGNSQVYSCEFIGGVQNECRE